MEGHLLAGLTVGVLAGWLRRTSRKTGFIWAPLAFMTAATLYALVLLIQQYGLSLIGVIAIVLLGLAVLLIVEAVRTGSLRSSGVKQAGDDVQSPPA